MKIENLIIILRAIIEMLKRLNNLRRWTLFTTKGAYDEISKQAFNCNVCYSLANEVERRGNLISWERFPKIAIYRAFQKAYVNYDTPEHILKEICDLGNISFEKVFGNVTVQMISELTNEDFANWIKEGCGTLEETIYKAATCIATLLELKEIQMHIKDDYEHEYDQVIKKMTQYENLPGFREIVNAESGCFEFFKAISKLRNKNRWAAYSYNVECSVLGHLFDTAVFAYLMALEKGETEQIATKCFFMGIFHDVPETFTTDIPSPIKDKIPGFRKLTEQYEMQMMEKHVYSRVYPRIASDIQRIMFEEGENAKYKRLMKGADYTSAVSEICRQLEAGSRDKSFFKAMRLHKEKLFNSDSVELTPTVKEFLKQIIDDAILLEI